MGRIAIDMKGVQAVSLEILKTFSDICEANGFRYMLTWGTLIGAIRHKGFIPWDDDIDVLMPRPDFEKFQTYFNNHAEELRPLRLFTSETKDYPYLIPRLSNDDYPLDVDNEKPCGMGVFVDIFILDGTGDSPEDAHRYIKSLCKYPRLIFLATRQHFEFGTTQGFFKKLIKFPVYCYAKLMGRDYFVKKQLGYIDKESYNKKQYVGCALLCERPRFGVIEKKDVEDLISVPFEKYMFKVPRAYDKLLKMWYGNYMQVPPEKDRIPHHIYQAFKKE
jgi:lipopolysaccharide cholinephosphotransferase